MTIKQAEYVVTVAKLGSISKAAKELFISQSNLSTVIKSIEKKYNITIFRRTSRGVELTMSGSEFVEDIRQLVDQYNYIGDKYSSPLQETVFLSVSAQHHVCGESVFMDIVKTHSDDNFRLAYLEGSTEEILNEVANGISDIGLLFFFDSAKNIVLHDLRHRGMVFNHITYNKPHAYFHCDHPLAGRAFTTLDEVLSCPNISYDANSTTTSVYTPTLRHTIKKNQTFLVKDRANAYTLMRNTQAYVIGAGYLPEDEAYNDIICVPIISPDNIEVGWITKEKQKLSGAAEEFISILKRSYIYGTYND
jgi:DNA-binding transcriptional LysR family regulator